MQFVYHKKAGEAEITLEGEDYHHIFRVRRHKAESLALRNLEDTNIYFYKITFLDKRESHLSLQHTEETNLQNPPKGHLIWAFIEPKIIEKTIPFLNELNLTQITFFYADFSQKQYHLDLERVARIIEHSCEQCGRITRLKIEILAHLDEVLQKYPKIAVMDFCTQSISAPLEIPFLIGPEGGLSTKEREILQPQFHFSAPNCNILRSETAAIYALSKII